MCTPAGVYMPALIPEKHIPVDHPERVLQVRTRRAIDLERLRDMYMGDDLGEILESPEMDYNFRAYCSLEAWATACYKMAMDIDYIKFKEQSEKKFPGKDGKLLHSVYTSIWSTLTRLGAPYTGDGTHAAKIPAGFYADDDWFGVGATGSKDEKTRVLDLLDALDGQHVTEDEAFGELARMAESTWSPFVKPYEHEAILARRSTVNHRRRTKLKRTLRKKVAS